MKKIKIGILALIACLFLTGCGCSNNKINEFIVTFDSNGGTVVEDRMVTKGEKVAEPTTPTKEGYIFDGWYIAGGEKYDFSSKINGDVELEAKWIKDESSQNKPETPTCKLTCEDGYELVNKDSKDCECKKKVVEVSSITLSKTQVTLLVGGSTTVTATVNPSNADNKTVSWTSSNTKVATVANGKITAVAVGSAKITVTAGGKSNTINVTVTTQDKLNLTAAMNSMTAKNITKGNTNINYTYNGCTINNTANTPSNGKTVVEIGMVKSLYRDVTAGSINSTYNVTCGAESSTKTVKHIITASSYTYDVVENTQTRQSKFIVYLGNEIASDYVVTVGTSKFPYVKTSKASLVPMELYNLGTKYSMVLNNDANTVYAVKYKG